MGKDVGFCMVSSAYCAMRIFSVNSLIRFPKSGMASIALSYVLLAMVFVVEGYNPQDLSFFHRGWKISATL